MPELPEVEALRRKLEVWAVGRSISTFASSGLHRGVEAGLGQVIVGRHVVAIDRRGKFLLVHLGPIMLVAHLGMSGRFIYRQGAAHLQNRHDHLAVGFDDGHALVFNDFRRFGRVFVCPPDRSGLPPLGDEPLSNDFDTSRLATALRSRRGRLKAILMDQAVVAGLGNIYACESLWAARLAPTRPAANLDHKETEVLTGAIRDVLARAIAAGGATLDDYRGTTGEMGNFDQSFAVFGRVGQPCPACGYPIAAGRVTGRITYWCPNCQR